MPSKYIRGGDIPTFFDDGPRVRVWGNLNERCMSLDWNGSGGVKWLKNHKLVLENPRFHVQPAGHRKIAEGASRSVVARVSGDVVDVVDLWEKRHDIHARIAPPMVMDPRDRWEEISYNPVDRGHLPFHTVSGHIPVLDGMCEALIIKHDRGFNTRTNVRMWGLLV